MVICPVCKTPRRSDGAFCEECGYRFEDKHCPRCNNIIDKESLFCRQCGYNLHQKMQVQPESNMPSQPAAQQQMVYDAPLQNANFNIPVQKKKSNKALKVIIILIVVAGALAAAFFLTRPLWDKKSQTTNTPVVSEPAEKKEPAPPVLSYDAPSVIRPSLYQSIEYLVYFKGSSEVDKEVLLSVEIPEFTQKYEQKITLKPQETRLKIRPPMIEGILKTLNISREAQIKISLQDMATKDYLIQDSKPVTILSKNDMKWASDDGSETYYQNICAWVTPESPEIKELLRNSIDQLTIWSDGTVNAMVGYQQIGDMNYYDITYFQVAAIFETMRNYYGVRYNATPISTSGKEAQQRIALPSEVLKQKSGLCIETAITMASAIEATGMHPMILILPGHAQVAVEDWKDSGEYYLLETTALTEPDWNNIMIYLDKEQWSNYLEQNQVTVIDVELARKDGIKPME